MSVLKLILTYSFRLISREWRRFLLSFFSLSITVVLLYVILLVTGASSLLLSQQAKEITGGDVILKSREPFVTENFWQAVGIRPDLESDLYDFNATFKSNSKSTPFSVTVVDDNYPLYGEFKLETGKYRYPLADQVYLDKTGAERLGVKTGDEIFFGEAGYIVAGIILTKPTSLFEGLQFLPSVFMSEAGFANAKVDLRLLRPDYEYASKFILLTEANKTKIRAEVSQYNRTLRVELAGSGRGGLQFGLTLVSDFLLVALLITAVLATVNVYASTIYLLTVERKSLAILLALGLRKSRLVLTLGTTLLYVVAIASLFGLLIGTLSFDEISRYIEVNYKVLLPVPEFILSGVISVGFITIIALTAFVPAVLSTLSQKPREILNSEGLGNTSRQATTKFIVVVTVFTLMPLVTLAIYLLRDIYQGLITVIAIGLVYLIVAGIFTWFLSRLYYKRRNFKLFWRSIISQKKADGLFGIISFTSLFVALTALSTLVLLQASLQQYLVSDLGATLPTTYVLDVQPSQIASLGSDFPDLTLYQNISARIIAIDELMIQEELSADTGRVDRELGREFNLTARDYLLASERVTAGVWGEGRVGEISVDEEFANRSNIKLGSTITFSIQGIEVSGTVTSLRESDTRTGLPFFYFVLSPQDVGDFPGVSFGYSNFDDSEQLRLGEFVANNMPNVSVIETETIGPIILDIVSSLLVMVLIVTLPPLLIALLLIVTMVVFSYSARRKEGARFRALGLTKLAVLKQYLAETISLTVFASVASYSISVFATYVISIHFLEITSYVIFDVKLLVGLTAIVVLVGLIGYYLFKTDTTPLRELLSYESNH